MTGEPHGHNVGLRRQRHGQLYGEGLAHRRAGDAEIDERRAAQRAVVQHPRPRLGPRVIRADPDGLARTNGHIGAAGSRARGGDRRRRELTGSSDGVPTGRDRSPWPAAGAASCPHPLRARTAATATAARKGRRSALSCIPRRAGRSGRRPYRPTRTPGAADIRTAAATPGVVRLASLFAGGPSRGLVGVGGDEGTRTPNPRLAKAVLYQLSYVPAVARGRTHAVRSAGVPVDPVGRLGPQVFLGVAVGGDLLPGDQRRRPRPRPRPAASYIARPPGTVR